MEEIKKETTEIKAEEATEVKVDEVKAETIACINSDISDKVIEQVYALGIRNGVELARKMNEAEKAKSKKKEKVKKDPLIVRAMRKIGYEKIQKPEKKGEKTK